MLIVKSQVWWCDNMDQTPKTQCKIVSSWFCVMSGINIFLDGYVPTENLRFRETSLVFKVAETANEEEVKRLRHYQVSSQNQFFFLLVFLSRSKTLVLIIKQMSRFCFILVSRNEEDDGGVHARDQRRRVHRLWDCGDVRRERWVSTRLPAHFKTDSSFTEVRIYLWQG